MSFEIFLNSYEHGESVETLPMTLMESVFWAAVMTRSVEAEDLVLWRIRYPAGRPSRMPLVASESRYPLAEEDGSDLYVSLDATGQRTSGFMIINPARSLRCYEALLTLLQAGPSALYWSDEQSIVVGREDSIEHLPVGIVEALGTPFVAMHPEQVIERIRQHRPHGGDSGGLRA